MSNAMPLHGKTLVIVDPSSAGGLLALERALTTNELLKTSGYAEPLQLNVLLAVDADNVDTSARNEAILRNNDWLLENIYHRLRASGYVFKIDISWSTDWYGTILRAAAAEPVDMIMLPLAHKPRESGRLLNESVWRLMRTCKVPILFAQPTTAPQRKVLLAAVNFQSHKPAHQHLNEQTLAASKALAKLYGADLHLVNAYADSLHYPDRGQLANSSGIETGRIHVRSGDPDDVIAQVAKEIDADIVILGTRPRESRWRGTTSERIITKVNCDIFTTH
jgi:universal stress protein E